MPKLDEPRIRIRPNKSRGGKQQELSKWAPLFVALTRASRQSGRARPKHPQTTRVRALSVPVQRSQRVAVRMSYTAPKTNGHWKAHGSYLQRESATGKDHAGFNAGQEGLAVSQTLASWQDAGDPRLFKIIISPEAGDRLDMQAYTQKVMSRVQEEVGAPLEWVAVAHYNTDHPHVHVALRGISKDGQEVRFSKAYVQHGLREHAERVATASLGQRTEREIRKNREKEVEQTRITSIDRSIMRLRTKHFRGKEFDVSTAPETFAKLPNEQRDLAQAMQDRLSALEKIGLVARIGPTQWRVPADYTNKLRTLEMAGDRQRMLARHMEFASSTHLPVQVADWKRFKQVEGRVLGNGEEETTGKRYLLVEGIDGRIHYIQHRNEIEELRSKGGLRNNEYVTLRKYKGQLKVKEYGHAEKLLKDAHFMGYRHSSHDAVTQPRPGWLGRFDISVAQHAFKREKAMSAENNQTLTSVPLTIPQVNALVQAEPAILRGREQALVQLVYKNEPLVIEQGKLTLRTTENGSVVAEMPASAVPEFQTRLSVAEDLQNDAALEAYMQDESPYGYRAGIEEALGAAEQDFRTWETLRGQPETLTAEEQAAVAHDVAVFDGIAAQQQNSLRQQELRSDIQAEIADDTNTALVPRPVDQAELQELRREAAEQLQREEFEITAASDPEGTYYGLIVADSENFIAQEDTDGDVILHDKDKLQTLPGVGERANIGYTARYPKAHVMTDRSKERGDIER